MFVVTTNWSNNPDYQPTTAISVRRAAQFALQADNAMYWLTKVGHFDVFSCEDRAESEVLRIYFRGKCQDFTNSGLDLMSSSFMSKGMRANIMHSRDAALCNEELDDEELPARERVSVKISRGFVHGS